MPEPAPPDAGEQPRTRLETGIGFALVLLLTVLLCLYAAFLVPLRIGTVRLPVALLVAGGGNLLLGRAGGRLLGTTGVLLPGLLWLGLAFLLGSTRAEGDLVVPGDVVGTLFLAVGTLGFGVAYATTSSRRQPTSSPRPPTDR